MSNPVHVPSSLWNSNGSYGASEQTVNLPSAIGVNVNSCTVAEPAAVVSDDESLPPHAATTNESAASDASRRVVRAMVTPRGVVGNVSTTLDHPPRGSHFGHI